MNCMICEKELSGGLDTYGDVGSEVCHECHIDLLEESGDHEPTLRELIAREEHWLSSQPIVSDAQPERKTIFEQYECYKSYRAETIAAGDVFLDFSIWRKQG